jgi:hypothetical protein
MLWSLEPVYSLYSLLKNQDFKHVRLLEYPGSYSRIFKAGSKEGLYTVQAVLYQDRVVTECNSKDIGNKAEDRQFLFTEEVDRALNSRQQGYRRGQGREIYTA